MWRGFLILANYLLTAYFIRRWFKMNPRKRKFLKRQAAQKAAPAPEPVVEVAPPAPAPEPEPEVEEKLKKTTRKPKARRSSKK
jgi:hypothetical protein